MKTDKQKAIEKAYGKYWELLNGFIHADSGKLNWDIFSYHQINIALTIPQDLFRIRQELDLVEYANTSGTFLIPKSLRNIETNNGWITVEKDKSNLPEDLMVCNFIPCGFKDQQFVGFIKDDEVYFVDDNLKVNKRNEHDLLYLNSWLKCQITHYQPIQKPTPPLF